ncbi:MAG: radical SAM protein, partial [Candidatus Thorarchaeota archaeon]
DLAQMGVMPVVVPFRPASGSILADATPSYVGNLDATLSLYKGVGRILFDNGLDPSRTLAGCHRCGACTPIGEAYDWAAGEG